ncbi:MAG: type II secretion system F family protein [Candidatus Omnitrophota bacterium]
MNFKQYKYKAKDKNNDLVDDIISARSKYEATNSIKDKGLVVISIAEDMPVLPSNKDRTGSKILKRPKTNFKISPTDFYLFCRQLCVSINSGISLIDALSAIAVDIQDINFKSALIDIINEIKHGKSFSQAIAKYKNIFNPLFIAMIESAEESGSLSQILGYLSKHFEKSEKLKNKLRSITAYPIFVLVFFVVVIFLITLFVLPRFESIFASFGTELPAFTKLIFSVNKFFVNNIFFLIGGFFVLTTVFRWYMKTEKGRNSIDFLKLKIPFLGNMLKKILLARFCYVLSIMLRGAVPIDKAMEIALNTCENKTLEKSLNKIRLNVVKGLDISSSFAQDKNFPNLMVRMVNIGEASGQLPDTLGSVAEMYEEQVESYISVFTALLEPIVIVLFGGVILVIILAIYVPVFKITMTAKSAF